MKDACDDVEQRGESAVQRGGDVRRHRVVFRV
jgi:hypothetical protein